MKPRAKISAPGEDSAPESRRLETLEWLPAARARQLEKFGIATVGDLLTHLPHRHEDRRRFDAFPREESAQAVCVCGVVTKTQARRFGGGRWMFDATLQEEAGHALSGTLVCRWFNLYYVQKVIAVGQRLIVYGKPKRVGKQIVLDHPEFEEINPEGGENGDAAQETETPHLGRIAPVHPATAGITPRELRGWIFRLLSEIDAPTATAMEGPLPATLSTMPYFEALRAFHFPESWEALAAARRELALGEFFLMQLYLAARRAETAARPGRVHQAPGRLLEAFHARLPFPLTGAQKRAIDEIRRDLAAPQPMNRMLHGDVGSGKTVVALSAMLLAVEAGAQAALMAPTQILAEQHYLNFRRWLEPLGVRVALRTGARREESALPLFDGQAEGAPPQIVVGTHALLYGEGEGAGSVSAAPPGRPGLAVIDEQHKFGVLQRAALTGGGDGDGKEAAPDVLVMTATPIPRTLTMTLYGDLDISTLDELPAGRGRIVTAARDAAKLPEAVAFIKGHLDAGRQAYVVYPLIEQSAKLEAKAAAAEFEQWRERFAPHRCELLHGRVAPEEKEAIMDRFRRNESQVLVATTVVEVGLDVPNASIMLIENAERFGLAQLHQLRGRIGRGVHKSYCILLHAADTPEGAEKMRTMEATCNGFEIAEADLRLRGPGDLLGTAQSGLPPLRLGDLLADAELVRLARRAATELFAADPQLAAPENRRFRRLLAARRGAPPVLAG